MKVALVILHADPAKGGAEGYTVHLAGALAGRGHDVSLVAVTFGQAARNGDIANIPLDGSGLTRRARYRSFVDSLDAQLATTRYDVVHAIAPVRRCDFYHPQAGLAAEALASGHLKYDGLRRPLDRIGTRLNPKRQFVGAVERALLTGPDAPTLLCVSDMVKSTARRHYPQLPQDKLVTLFNAIDPARFDPARRPEARAEIRRQWGVGEEKVVALIVAQDFVRKGVRPAIEALARVEEERMVLVVVGKPDPAPYRELAQSLNVRHRVVFAGPTTDTHGAYAGGDFFVLPTHHDPCSLVVLEALAMGLPTITTTANGAYEVMTEGRHGFILNDPADPAPLAAAMRKMLDDAARRSMSENCRDLRPRLSYDHHLDQLEALYHQKAGLALSRPTAAGGKSWSSSGAT